MLKIDALRFAYPGQSTPYSFELEIDAGEIIAISGASGSGKSTLLDLIAGFLVPSGGEIDLDGANLVSLPPEARPVSILFQDNNLFDHLTVADNIALGLSDNADKASAVAEVLDRVGLSGYETRRARNLSGGQQQRVALARTLLRNTPVLLLDEPFNGLDSKTAASMRTLVKELTAANKWHVVLVSHDAADAEALADRKFSLEARGLRPLEAA